ncbi:MAG: hypothetical protein ACKVT0_03750 [Planctomycetaceae bacterium]
MTTTNGRIKWLEMHRQLSEEAEYTKNSQMVPFGLLNAYDELSAVEKMEIFTILADWLVSEDNKLRYDAAFLISQRKIVEMASAVKNAIERTDESSGPEAKHELKKLLRIFEELT